MIDALRNGSLRTIFISGLAIRVAMILLVVPVVQTDWFLPFVESWILAPSLDPWTNFLKIPDSDLLSFPYGPIMLLAHAPFVAAGLGIDGLFGTSYFSGLGFRASLLLADFLVLWILFQLFPQHFKQLLIFYWLSPVVLYISYWHGQTDVIPVALLMSGLLQVSRHKLPLAGVYFGLAVAAKHSMFVIVPIMLVYVFQNQRYRVYLTRFTLCIAATLLLWIAPALLSDGFQLMALGNPENSRLFHLKASLGPDISLYFTPLLYVLLLYFIWRLTWVTFDLLLVVMGLVFFILTLSNPAPAGWFFWLVPFLVAHQLRLGPTNVLALAIFSALILGYHIIYSAGAYIPLFDFSADQIAAAILPAQLQSLAMTLLVGFGFVVVVQFVREGFLSNSIFKISRKPIAIAIAGDSGSGKDTLSLSLAGLFGEHSAVLVSGDDYHNWDREGGLWQAMTHLNPRANQLSRFSGDVLDLCQRKTISCRTYDHETGRFTNLAPRHSRNLLIASGLHALYSPTLNEQFDVRIYLDMDEGLRRALKISRDTQHRGHSKTEVLDALKHRQADAEKFIRPQADNADLVFRLEAIGEPTEHAELRLWITIRGRHYQETLSRLLIGICGLRIDFDESHSKQESKLMIEGDVDADDIALAAASIDSDLVELLDLKPDWSDGLTGVMQLTVMLHLDEALRAKNR